jgi:LPXTG-motif cell wall-anchored protein
MSSSTSTIKLGHLPDSGSSPFGNPLGEKEADLANFKTFDTEYDKPKEQPIVVAPQKKPPVVPEGVTEIAKKSSPTAMIIIVLLILILAAAGVFYFIKKKKS